MRQVLIFDSKEQSEKVVGLYKIVKVKIGDQTLCLTRTAAGFFAFEKDCPHMTDDLGRGKINNQNEIVCPWHAYRFNLQSGEEAERRSGDLNVFSTYWEEGKLFVQLPEDL